jgi:hypothetical protein
MCVSIYGDQWPGGGDLRNAGEEEGEEVSEEVLEEEVGSTYRTELSVLTGTFRDPADPL